MMRAATIHEAVFDGTAFDIRLQCPRCRSDLSEFTCLQCAMQLHVIGGVVHALPPERSEHYARFVEDYERIRAAEGRGSENDAFYLGLPYRDASGRNSAQWQIRARSFDSLVKNVLRLKPQHSRQRVLDLGAGNCWMSFRLAQAGCSPVAVDLLTNQRDGLGAGERYRNHLPRMFPRFQAELARLPFQDDQFDAAVFNASFHYADDYEAALREALRCVRKDGMAIICDTPWYSSESSGLEMVSERRATFLRRYGTASDSIRSMEYLTDERLRLLEERLSIRWTIHSPHYGWKWAMRPIVARLRSRREPSRFRIFAARKVSA
jgi:ubiquinone/menaquinone biosynthesis C-methylase UbiE